MRLTVVSALPIFALMEAAIRAAANFGTQQALADALGVTQPTVSQWVRGERPVPTRFCALIERHPANLAADRPVMRWDLRPDDWRAIWPELIGSEGAPTAPEAVAAGEVRNAA